MSFWVTDKEVYNILKVTGRELPMPDGTVRTFAGFNHMRRAFDFVVVVGKRSRRKLVGIAIRIHTGEVQPTDLRPKAQSQAVPVSVLAIEMLESPCVNPVLIRERTDLGFHWMMPCTRLFRAYIGTFRNDWAKPPVPAKREGVNMHR